MKPEVHQALTRHAIRCVSDRLPESVLRHTEQIIAGTKAEDNWWEPARLWNWHFYRSNGDIPEKIGPGMRPTSETILAKRITQMQKRHEDDPQRYRCLGRVLHHIQDMSTPSHVVPIYHDHRIHDHFESFMVCAVKGFAPQVDSSAVTAGHTDLIAIYNNAARQMLHFLATRTFRATIDGGQKDLPLSLFWSGVKEQPDKKYPGFGSYGILHECFVRSRPIAVTAEGVEYSVDYAELQRLNDAICNQAVTNSCTALLNAF